MKQGLVWGPCVGAIIAIGACNGSSASSRETPPHHDAGLPDAAVAPLADVVVAPLADVASIGARQIDSLDARDLRAICEAANQRSNGCTETALRTTTTTADCKASESACFAQYGDAGYKPSCNSDLMWNGTTCTATVDQYLDCVSSFQSALSCDKAGYAIATDACTAVMNACPAFTQFHISGKLPPCTAEESAGNPVRTDDDIYGADGCTSPPARFIVLGDSIADCTGVDMNTTVCAPNLIAEHLRASLGPTLAFETHAVDGAKVEDLLSQAMKVAGGPEHVYVWTYCMGNDLTDVATGTTDVSTLVTGYKAMFDYFADTSRFPGGATFLLNTQYNPNDECRVPGAKSYPASIDDLIISVNKTLILDVAEARPDAVAIDQLPDFLGHGNNANVHGCPYCGPDNTSWMNDVLHPNAAGNIHIAEKWYKAVDAMTGPACSRDAGSD